MDAPDGRPLHVALNAHLLSGDLSYRSAGVHQYIHHLLAYLPRAGCQVTAFVGPGGGIPIDGGGPLVQALRSRWPTARPAVRGVWEQLVQPLALRGVRVDLAHGPAFVGPLASSYPFVVTVHDLSFLRFPRLFRPANRLYLSALTRASVRRAQRVIAVSAHTAQETTQLLGIVREGIDIVYHGVDPEFRPLRPGEIAAFQARRRLPERFVLCVGTLEPRKNLIRLVEAFARLRDPAARLVLVGGRGWYDQEIFARVEKLELHESVIFPGYVPAEELPLWYNAASVFAYPSLYEGFGMPVLEAQACGTPVLTSDCSALPEAAGDAAVLVDPYDVETIAEGLHQLLSDKALRETLRQQGLAHAARFTWQQTAAETLLVYRQALGKDGQA